MALRQFRHLRRPHRNLGVAAGVRTLLRAACRAHQRKLFADPGRRRGAGAIPAAGGGRHQARRLDRLRTNDGAKSRGRPLHHGLGCRPARAALCRAQARGLSALCRLEPGNPGYRQRLAALHGRPSGVRHSRDLVSGGPDPAGDAQDVRALCRGRTAGDARSKFKASAEDGGGRATDRRRRPRFQQPPDHHPRQSADGAAAKPGGQDQNPDVECVSGRRPRRGADQAPAGVFAQPAARSASDRRQPAGGRHVGPAGPHAGRDGRGRDRAQRRPVAHRSRRVRNWKPRSSISRSTRATRWPKAARSPSRPATRFSTSFIASRSKA